MKTVLVVEDSAMVVKVLHHVLARSTQIHPVFASSFSAAREIVASGEYTFFAALVDLSLPDAPEGEVVDYTLSLDIPTVVLTGSFDEERREQLLGKGIVDYVTKEGRFSYEYALGVLHRLVKNQAISVLVVDDSATQRRFICGLLRLQLYNVLEAEDGVGALKVLLAHPEIKMLITDYHMPNMDGFELVKTIRGKYHKSDLAVIGVSSEGEAALSARFIKNGANDFLRKPFNHEEFFCRVTHNIEFIEQVEMLQDIANRDELTGCYNRRYFFDIGIPVYERAISRGTPLSLAVIDLENFREINERYGHEIGNIVMRQVAEALSSAFDRFLLARADGHSFFALLAGLSNDKAVAFVDRVRQVIGRGVSVLGEEALEVVFSAGVSSQTGEDIDAMLNNASACLQRARDAGGDLVFGDD